MEQQTWINVTIDAVKILMVFGAVLTAVPFMVLLERVLIARIQQRVGPNRVGLSFLPGLGWLKNKFIIGGILQTIVDGIKLLAETTGIFTETAGGVTTAVLAKLAAAGKVHSSEEIVVYITGDGLKTLDAVSGTLSTYEIDPDLSQFEEEVLSDNAVAGESGGVNEETGADGRKKAV